MNEDSIVKRAEAMCAAEQMAQHKELDEEVDAGIWGRGCGGWGIPFGEQCGGCQDCHHMQISYYHDWTQEDVREFWIRKARA